MVRSPHALLLLLPLLFAGCDQTSRLPGYELTGSALGTTFSVLLVAPGEHFAGDELQSSILAEIESVDMLASTWRDDSELSMFNANPAGGWIETSAEFCTAIERALEISRQTDGAFDITVGPLVNLWGFGPDGDISEPPTENALQTAMRRVGYQGLQTRCERPAVKKRQPDLYIDLSGWAKGYAVDKIAMLLDEREFKDYLVEIGGELRVRGHNAESLEWAVAIEAPSTTRRKPHSVLRVTDASVATSGDYRNFFNHDGQLYSHTIDARTGRPIAHALAAVTVVNASAAYADAMATALLVLGPDEGPERARELDIAAFFLIRYESRFEEIATSSFDRLRTS